MSCDLIQILWRIFLQNNVFEQWPVPGGLPLWGHSLDNQNLEEWDLSRRTSHRCSLLQSRPHRACHCLWREESYLPGNDTQPSMFNNFHIQWGFEYTGDMNVTDGMLLLNRTSSMHISVLFYLLDKAQYLGLEFSLCPLLFPNKKAETPQRVRLLVW